MQLWRFSASEDKFSLESYIVEAHEEEDGPVRQCEAPADEMVVTRGERAVRVWRKASGGGGDGEWFLQSSVSYKNRAVDAFAVSPGTRLNQCFIRVFYLSKGSFKSQGYFRG